MRVNRCAPILILLLACAGEQPLDIADQLYIHEPTGIAFPPYLGELVRDKPTSNSPYVHGGVGVGYHRAGVPSVLVTLMPAPNREPSDPTEMLYAILNLEKSRGMDAELLYTGTVSAICDDQEIPFSYLVAATPFGKEVRFSAKIRDYIVYISGLAAVSEELLSPLLAGLFMNLTFPCTVPTA